MCKEADTRVCATAWLEGRRVGSSQCPRTAQWRCQRTQLVQRLKSCSLDQALRYTQQWWIFKKQTNKQKKNLHLPRILAREMDPLAQPLQEHPLVGKTMVGKVYHGLYVCVPHKIHMLKTSCPRWWYKEVGLWSDLVQRAEPSKMGSVPS